MTQNPELSVVGRIEAMPELPEPCGAMSVDDGPYTGKGSDLPHMQGARLERSVDGYSAAQMHAYALTYASQTLASRDGEIARLRGALEPFANIAYYEELVSAMSATLERYEEQSALIAAFINARAVLVVAPQPTKEQSNG